MNEIENLGCNTYGMNLYTGKITPNKNHSVSIFLIVENTDDKEVIYKEALQMLDAFGQSNFHFYGKQEPLWHFAFDEIDSQLNIEKNFSNTIGYETLEEFVDELQDERHMHTIIPSDYYLIYDDREIYNKVKQMIKI